MHIIIDTYRLAPGCGSDAYGWDELDAHVEHASSHQSQALLADGHHTRHQLLYEKKKIIFKNIDDDDDDDIVAHYYIRFKLTVEVDETQAYFPSYFIILLNDERTSRKT